MGKFRILRAVFLEFKFVPGGCTYSSIPSFLKEIAGLEILVDSSYIDVFPMDHYYVFACFASKFACYLVPIFLLEVCPNE